MSDWVFMVSSVIIFAAVVLMSRCVLILDKSIRADKADHAKCVAHVAHYVGDAFAAQVLRLAASDMASVEGQTELRTISHSDRIRIGDGQVIAALWLEDRADALDWQDEGESA